MATVKIKGLDKFNRDFKRHAKNISKGSPVFNEIGELWARDVKKIFDIGGDPKWKPSGRASAGGTVKAGKRKGQMKKGKTLIRHSHLKNSIMPRVEGNKIILGTNKVYAAIHNYGGKTGRGHKVTMTKREFMMLRPSIMRDILKRLTRAATK